jgi:hypothetical protein
MLTWFACVSYPSQPSVLPHRHSSTHACRRTMNAKEARALADLGTCSASGPTPVPFTTDISEKAATHSNKGNLPADACLEHRWRMSCRPCLHRLVVDAIGDSTPEVVIWQAGEQTRILELPAFGAPSPATACVAPCFHGTRGIRASRPFAACQARRDALAPSHSQVAGSTINQKPDTGINTAQISAKASRLLPSPARPAAVLPRPARARTGLAGEPSKFLVTR